MLQLNFAFFRSTFHFFWKAQVSVCSVWVLHQRNGIDRMSYTIWVLWDGHLVIELYINQKQAVTKLFTGNTLGFDGLWEREELHILLFQLLLLLFSRASDFQMGLRMWWTKIVFYKEMIHETRKELPHHRS